MSNQTITEPTLAQTEIPVAQTEAPVAEPESESPLQKAEHAAEELLHEAEELVQEGVAAVERVVRTAVDACEHLETRLIGHDAGREKRECPECGAVIVQGDPVQ